MNTRLKSTRRKHIQKLGGKFRRRWLTRFTKRKHGASKKCTIRKHK